MLRIDYTNDYRLSLKYIFKVYLKYTIVSPRDLVSPCGKLENRNKYATSSTHIKDNSDT